MVKATETPAQDHTLERRSKEMFDASVDDLDANIRSRLRQARHAAAQAGGRSRRPIWWLPTLASAAVAGLVILLLPVLNPQQPPLTDSFTAADDMNLLMNDESLDLLEEMEFYVWLDDTPDAFDKPAESEHGDS